MTKRKQISYLVVLIVTVGCLISLFLFLAHSLEASRRQAIKDAVTQAAVQCYSIEGAYPQSVTYLEDHYGLTIDRDHYIISYNAFASNVTPVVEVLQYE